MSRHLAENKLIKNLTGHQIPNFYLIITAPKSGGKTVLASKIILSTDNNNQPLLDYDTLTVFAPTTNQRIWSLIIHGFNNGLNRSIIQDIINQNDNVTPPQLQIKAVASLLDPKQKFIDDVIAYEYRDIKQVPRVGELDPTLHNLVIFDDILGLNKNQSKIVEYFTTGRHSNCSLILLTQSFFEISKTIRLQADMFIFLYPLSRIDRENFFKTNNTPCETLAEFTKFVKERLKKKYDFMTLLTTDPDQSYIEQDTFLQLLNENN